jgi:biotin transport system substrate-specific component
MAHPLTLSRPAAIPASDPLWRKLVVAIAATVLMAIAAHVSVPLFFTPVPLTLQTFAVLFIGLGLGPRSAFAALSLYLLEGAIGLPVFSPHGPGGIAQLLGPTGGYLLSYPFAAALAGILYQRRGGFARAAFSAAVASLVILLAGSAWMAAVLHLDARTVASMAIVPFLPGDMLKVCAAAAAVTTAQAIRRARPQPSSSNEL